MKQCVTHHSIVLHCTHWCTSPISAQFWICRWSTLMKLSPFLRALDLIYHAWQALFEPDWQVPLNNNVLRQPSMWVHTHKLWAMCHYLGTSTRNTLNMFQLVSVLNVRPNDNSSVLLHTCDVPMWSTWLECDGQMLLNPRTCWWSYCKNAWGWYCEGVCAHRTSYTNLLNWVVVDPEVTPVRSIRMISEGNYQERPMQACIHFCWKLRTLSMFDTHVWFTYCWWLAVTNVAWRYLLSPVVLHWKYVNIFEDL